MKKPCCFVGCFSLICLCILCTAREKLRSTQLNMYITTSFDFCMRYLTRTRVTGCSSHRSGNRGRLLIVTSVDELKNYRESNPLIVLMPPRKDLVDYAITESPKIVGIVIDGTSVDSEGNYFTEVNSCPEDLNASATCLIRKNEYGIDFRAIQINKPIFMINNRTAIDQLKKLSYVYNQQGNARGQHVDVHMKSYAYGVENAQICDRRSKMTYFGEAYYKHYSIKCRSPMINIVWSTFNAISTKQSRAAKSVIIFYTKIDFFSIFQPKNAGAQTTACGVITLLGLAWMFGQLNFSRFLIDSHADKDVLFVFLNGENWNYYGSMKLSEMITERRFPYRVDRSSNKQHLHPIEPEHIDIMINIDQLGCENGTTYILHDKSHPFLDKFKHVTSSLSVEYHQTDHLHFFTDFQAVNASALAMLTNAHEKMNPFYNSYRDTFDHLNNETSVLDHIYLILQVICDYVNFGPCPHGSLKEQLLDRIQALFDCFLRSNCSRLVAETDEWYFNEVSDRMRRNFSFLQPILHPSDVRAYLQDQFLDASSYIHDILLNSIAERTKNTTQAACDALEDVVASRIYQSATKTCLRVSINSINLLRNQNTEIDDRFLFVSNHDEPEFLVYMTPDTKRDSLMLICGLVLCLCGLASTYFLVHLLPLLLT